MENEVLKAKIEEMQRFLHSRPDYIEEHWPYQELELDQRIYRRGRVDESNATLIKFNEIFGEENV